jgi:7-cyano-7-deazaguanine synthase
MGQLKGGERSRHLLLLSGGMDSIALAYWNRPACTLTIDYGQRSAGGEIRAARAVTTHLGLPHEVVSIDARGLGSGDLADTAPLAIAPVPEWWPFRNQLLITIAATRALSYNCDAIELGSVASDSAHIDGTAMFVQAMDNVLSLQEGGIRLVAPALRLSTMELIQAASLPRQVLAWAHSCHRSDFACGVCRGCQKNLAVRSAIWGSDVTVAY